MLHGIRKGDVRALHRGRVASRRLRELVPVLQLENATAGKLSRRLRKVTRHLGVVRELDVLELIAAELQESGRHGAAGLRRVTAALSEERRAARERLLEKVSTAALERLASRLRRAVRELDEQDAKTRRAKSAGHGHSWHWAIDARVAHRASRLQRAMSEAGSVYLPERIHAVRIAVKKLRYALELSNEAAGVQSSSDVRALKRVQDLLGRMHDLQMLLARARQAQASLLPPNVVVWRELDAVIALLEDDCRQLHARYLRSRTPLTTMTARLAGRPPGTAATRRASRRVAGA